MEITSVQLVEQAAVSVNKTPRQLLKMTGYSEGNVYLWKKQGMSDIMKNKLLSKVAELKAKQSPVQKAQPTRLITKEAASAQLLLEQKQEEYTRVGTAIA